MSHPQFTMLQIWIPQLSAVHLTCQNFQSQGCTFTFSDLSSDLYIINLPPVGSVPVSCLTNSAKLFDKAQSLVFLDIQKPIHGGEKILVESELSSAQG